MSLAVALSWARTDTLGKTPLRTKMTAKTGILSLLNGMIWLTVAPENIPLVCDREAI
jgi:hypothetical protein